MESRHVVIVVGGAVSGSEAARQLAEKGTVVVCIEQNPLPYGKIEDGLPRWHVEQRKKEEEKIDAKLDHPLIHYVPSTRIGRDLSFDEIRDWGASAVLLANGAWRDRPLGIDGIDRYLGKGLAYQNPLVYWFNHYHEPGYSGARYDIPDNTAVIGGGLASMDVMKICQIEITRKALKARGIETDPLDLEKEGIPKFLEGKGLTWSDLGLKGTTLFYRRRLEDMPLAEVPAEATPEQAEKFGALRKKILGNFQSKYLFNFHDRSLPVKTIVENDRLAGLVFAETEISGKTAKPVPGSEKEVRCNLVVGSIGSIPVPIPGLPGKGEFYDVADKETGSVRGMPDTYATGNAVTGKGNIRVSLLHGRQVAQHLLETLSTRSKLEPSGVEKILSKVKQRQQAAGYGGDYAAWRDKHLAK